MADAATPVGTPDAAWLDADTIRESRARLGELLAGLGGEPLASRDHLQRVVAELSASVEELLVAEEELRTQTEELAASRDAIDVERERYGELFEFAPDAYLVTDELGRIVEANGAAGRLLGISSHFLEGKLLVSFSEEASRREVRALLNELRESVVVDERYLRLQPRDRPPFVAAIRAVSRRAPGSQSNLVRWMVRDVTTRLGLEEEIRVLHVEVELMASVARVARLTTEPRPIDSLLQSVVDLAASALPGCELVLSLGGAGTGPGASRTGAAGTGAAGTGGAGEGGAGTGGAGTSAAGTGGAGEGGADAGGDGERGAGTGGAGTGGSGSGTGAGAGAAAAAAAAAKSAPATVAASGERARWLDQAEAEGDGPCLRSIAGGSAAEVDLPACAGDWPRFAALAADLGLVAAVCLPIETPVHRGALKVFAFTELSREARQLLPMLAEQVTTAVANTELYESSHALAGHLELALESRGVIERAKGVLIARQGCDQDQAFDILRRASQRLNRKLRDVAVDLVNNATTGEVPDWAPWASSAPVARGGPRRSAAARPSRGQDDHGRAGDGKPAVPAATPTVPVVARAAMADVGPTAPAAPASPVDPADSVGPDDAGDPTGVTARTN